VGVDANGQPLAVDWRADATGPPGARLPAPRWHAPTPSVKAGHRAWDDVGTRGGGGGGGGGAWGSPGSQSAAAAARGSGPTFPPHSSPENYVGKAQPEAESHPQHSGSRSVRLTRRGLPLEGLPELPQVSLADPVAALAELGRQSQLLADRRRALLEELQLMSALHTKMAAVVANRRRRQRRAVARVARLAAGAGRRRGRRRGGAGGGDAAWSGPGGCASSDGTDLAGEGDHWQESGSGSPSHSGSSDEDGTASGSSDAEGSDSESEGGEPGPDSDSDDEGDDGTGNGRDDEAGARLYAPATALV
jgi:hypothetical protein